MSSSSTSWLSKKQKLYLVLSGIFLTNALVAEIVGAKIFDVAETIGPTTASLLMPFGGTFGYALSAGALLWPTVFITSDIINEYFGRPGVKRISYLTAGFIAYSFILIYVATLLAPARFWLDVNAQPAGFDINYAFGKIFRQGLGIILGSITAFLVAQLLDATVFQYLRRRTGRRMIWLRATGSTLVSQLIDSFVVLFIAFYVFGNWNMQQVLTVGLNNYTYKFIVAILLTPVLYLAHYLIDRYLGKEHADQLTAEAVQGIPTVL
ncbi:MAG: queuosine precursor transporter [Cytophagaceae bacterium]|nr:queuosine precursor transporter [Cytophagaceae bacterium]